MAEQFSLDLLGQHILAMRTDIATMKADLGAIRNQLDHHRDELDVVSGLAMRVTRERVAWASVQRQLAKLAAHIKVLERQGR
jgi:hypothetical protein